MNKKITPLFSAFLFLACLGAQGVFAQEATPEAPTPEVILPTETPALAPTLELPTLPPPTLEPPTLTPLPTLPPPTPVLPPPAVRAETTSVWMVGQPGEIAFVLDTTNAAPINSLEAQCSLPPTSLASTQIIPGAYAPDALVINNGVQGDGSWIFAVSQPSAPLPAGALFRMAAVGAVSGALNINCLLTGVGLDGARLPLAFLPFMVVLGDAPTLLPSETPIPSWTPVSEVLPEMTPTLAVPTDAVPTVEVPLEVSPTQNMAPEPSPTLEVPLEVSPAQDMTPEPSPTLEAPLEVSPTQDIAPEPSPTLEVPLEVSPTPDITPGAEITPTLPATVELTPTPEAVPPAEATALLPNTIAGQIALSDSAPTGVVVSLRSPDGTVVMLGVADDSGQFRFDVVPPGDYVVVAESVGYLSEALPVTLTDGGAAVAPIELFAGDIVPSDPPVIDELDVVQFTAWYGDPNAYDPRADFNRDGQIDIMDLRALAQNMRRGG